MIQKTAELSDLLSLFSSVIPSLPPLPSGRPTRRSSLLPSRPLVPHDARRSDLGRAVLGPHGGYLVYPVIYGVHLASLAHLEARSATVNRLRIE